MEITEKKAKEKEKIAKEKKDWTLMFFFASDNNLSASMFYQLKSLKTAGFQVDTNVLAHFDPHERGVPSMIFEINRNEKRGKKESRIGDDVDPIIRDLAGDQIEPQIVEDECRTNSSEFDDLPAEQALARFLDYARENYPANHYMLFLVGHGMIVGRDAFLPDENPNSGISLVDLGQILWTFSEEVRENDEQLELVAMHSCSMSAVEVAYELKGTANYMMASEGLSFVGAWPYRQMLQKIFCAIEDAKQTATKLKIPGLMKKIHELCLHNGADFIFAGYSSDLCLISLEEERVEALNGPIEKLTKALLAGLNDRRDRDHIVLAHWESQSYFQEVYTDLYDFCLCLRERCKGRETKAQEAMSTACKKVMDMLDAGTEGPIVQADFSGPDCQYSYGLSIYFPWSRPVEDESEHVIKNYRNYAFVTELSGASWLQFLNAYFEQTLRKPPRKIGELNDAEEKTWNFAAAAYKPFACHSGSTAAPNAALIGGKSSPADASGEFSYSVVKNYSRDFAISKRALKVFANGRGKKNT